MTADRVERIRALLARAFEPSVLDVRDDSHLHAGHAGARGGAGHYHVTITSTRFAGCSRVRRHQMVYAAVAELMPADIHALGIDARAPDEHH